MWGFLENEIVDVLGAVEENCTSRHLTEMYDQQMISPACTSCGKGRPTLTRRKVWKTRSYERLYSRKSSASESYTKSL